MKFLKNNINSRSLALPILIFTIALILRLWFIGLYSTPLIADETGYDRLATALFEGRGYVDAAGISTAHRPPGYPLFLYITFLLFGKSYFSVRLIQAVMDSILCILIYQLGRKLFNEKVGILAAIIAALHLGFIAQSAKILTEVLGTFLLFIAIIFSVRVNQNPQKKKYYFLSGIFIGMAILVRPNLLVIFLLLALAFIYNLAKLSCQPKVISKFLVIYFLAFLIPLLPWLARNYKVFRTVGLMTTIQGRTFYSAYKPLKGKIYGFIPQDEITKKAELMPSEVERNNFLIKETLKILKKEPSIFFKLLGLKMLYFFSPFDWELIREKVIYNYLYAFYLPFFIIGVFLFLNRAGELLPVYFPILGILFMVAIFFGIPRFRVPIEPYMIILSSSAIVYSYEKIKYKKFFIISLFAFFSFNFLLFLNSSLLKESLKIFLSSKGLW